MFCLVHEVLCTCRTVVSLQSCSWNVQWNPALRPARSDKTTSLLRPYSFKPNVKTIESFYYFKDPVNGTTSLLRFYGPTVVALTGFHCICFIDLWQVPFPQDENKNLVPFFSNFFYQSQKLVLANSRFTILFLKYIVEPRLTATLFIRPPRYYGHIRDP